MRWTLIGLVLACATPEERRAQARYYATHPMAECHELLREAELGKDMRNSQALSAGRQSEGGQINPCSVGCRIPACGYPPSYESP